MSTPLCSTVDACGILLSPLAPRTFHNHQYIVVRSRKARRHEERDEN